MAPFIPSPIVVHPDGDPWEDYKAGRKTTDEINAAYARLWPRCTPHGNPAAVVWQGQPICLECAKQIFTRQPPRIER